MTEEQLEGIWIVDPIKKTRLASVEYHFGEHGTEVNATDLDQYVRQALAFREEAKNATVLERPSLERRRGCGAGKNQDVLSILLLTTR